MRDFVLMTDSCCDMSEDMARELGVTHHCRMLVVSGTELLCDMLDELCK